MYNNIRYYGIPSFFLICVYLWFLHFRHVSAVIQGFAFALPVKVAAFPVPFKDVGNHFPPEWFF